MTEGGKKPPFAFERDKPGTNARTEAEADIESLRQRGGPFVEAVARTRMPMAVTDARLPGNPIVFANDAFVRLSGYSMREVLGQKPHFLNGPDTDPDDAARFREALRRGEDIVVDTWQYRKDGSPFYAALFVSPIADDDGQVIQHFLSYLDITRRVEAEQALRDHAGKLEEVVGARMAALQESEARLAAAFESVPVGVAVIDTAGAALLSNPEFRRFLPTGIVPSRDPATVGRWRAWDQQGRPLDPRDFPIARALRGETVVPGQEMLYTDDAGLEIWTAVSTVPIHDSTGHVTGVVSVISDIDAHKRNAEALRLSEEHQRVLIAELQHRVRNTLGIVRSIARRTAQNSSSIEDLSAHLDGRLDAFARVQAMVTRRPEAGIDLAALIEDELVAHAAREGQNVKLDGPAVALATRPAETLSLAIHELTTNAVKYGALSPADGKLAISWTMADGRFAFSWIESGVPGVSQTPEREGFGLELLRRVVPYELSAETEVEFRPDGLRFALSMPADGNIRSP